MTSTPDALPQRIALVGSPNSGKSTLFNALTGLRARVANYPGVTVDYSQGSLPLGETKATLIDLPGLYSFEALSPEEQVSLDILQGRGGEQAPKPDAAIFVADATSLLRTLPMLGALLRQFDRPVMLVLTMIDELKARHGMVQPLKLQRALGIPVTGVVGNRGVGLDDLKAKLCDPAKWERRTPQSQIPEAVTERFAWSDQLLSHCYEAPRQASTLTEALDHALLHPVFGSMIFALVMLFFFQAIFQWAAPLQDLCESGVTSLGQWLLSTMPAGLLREILVDGVIAGVGGVVVFVPQIALLFLLIALMEQSGYMSRAVFLIDRLMGWAGLDGRSFVSWLSSYACAVPGIMAARNIPDPRNRIVTILTAPLMTCAARLPVYTLLIAAFIPTYQVGGFLNLQGLVMFGLYLLGALSALAISALLRKGPMRGRTLPFYIELPPYRFPTFHALIRVVWVPVWSFLRRAGTLILLASLILWVLLNFPRTTPEPTVVKQGEQAVAAYQIQHSYAASIGKTLEPVVAPLGFDWRIAIGLVASLAAREVIVATMAQTYAVRAEDDDTKALSKKLRSTLYPPGSKKKFPYEQLAVALSLLIFFVFALQCVSTLAVMRRETGGWRWPFLSFTSLLLLAYSASFVTFRLTMWFGGSL